MNGTGYAIVAYVVGAALLWGYAISIAVSILLSGPAGRPSEHRGDDTP